IPGGMIFGNQCGSCNARWATTKYHDWAPRIGFAWNPNGGRYVIRGGYGVLYSPLQYTDFGGNQVQGYAGTPTFTSVNGFAPAFMNWNNVGVQDLSLGPVLNQPVTGNTLGVTAPYPTFFADWGANAPVWRAIRPYPQYDFIYMDVLQNIGQSTYQSLQATLER